MLEIGIGMLACRNNPKILHCWLWSLVLCTFTLVTSQAAPTAHAITALIQRLRGRWHPFPIFSLSTPRTNGNINSYTHQLDISWTASTLQSIAAALQSAVVMSAIANAIRFRTA